VIVPDDVTDIDARTFGYDAATLVIACAQASAACGKLRVNGDASDHELGRSGSNAIALDKARDLSSSRRWIFPAPV
jgi:hypothetical protein